MRHTILASSFLLLIFSLISVPAQAQTYREIVERLAVIAESDPDARDYLLALDQKLSFETRGSTESTKYYVLNKMIRAIYSVSSEGWIDTYKIDELLHSDLIENRVSIVRGLLFRDLDSDGVISLRESEVFGERFDGKLSIKFEEVDANSDNIISYSEILVFAQLKAKNSQHMYDVARLEIFDANDNGTVVAVEIGRTLDALERVPLLSIVNLTSRRECEVPIPGSNEDFVVLSVKGGGALSSVSIAGNGGATEIIDINIEEGDRQIYLLLSARSNIIWDISGATERLSTLVIQRSNAMYGPGAGVMGVDGSIVHFVDHNTCALSYTDLDEGKGLLAYRHIENSTGKAPDSMLAFRTISNVSLPSGSGNYSDYAEPSLTIFLGNNRILTPEGPIRLPDIPRQQLPNQFPYGATVVIEKLLERYPSGLRQVDADAVISPGDAIEYDVLPSSAGLLQLILERKIRYTSAGYYFVEEPIARFPAGLSARDNSRFILGPDVPMPIGQYQNTFSVFSSVTGECLSANCPFR